MAADWETQGQNLLLLEAWWFSLITNKKQHYLYISSHWRLKLIVANTGWEPAWTRGVKIPSLVQNSTFRHSFGLTRWLHSFQQTSRPLPGITSYSNTTKRTFVVRSRSQFQNSYTLESLHRSVWNQHVTVGRSQSTRGISQTGFVSKI